MIIKYFKRKTKKSNGFTLRLFNCMGKSKPRIRKKGAGFTVLFLAILISLIMIAITISITVLTIGEYRLSRNIIYSTKAYYAAEAGIEDVLLRLKKNLTLPASFSLASGQGTATIEVSDAVGGSRTIISEGNTSDLIRRVRVVYQISTEDISFYYGAQVGDGGMQMSNNSRIKGNVFSNGSVEAPTGKGFIDDTIVVARNSNKISGLDVGQDALVHTCEDSEIAGDLTYVLGGDAASCTAGGSTSVQADEIETQDLPISIDEINDWKVQAAAGGILESDFFLDGIDDHLGPIQIGTESEPKNLTVTNGSILTVDGVIYVTGDILFDNNSQVGLNQSIFGSNSGAIFADGKVIIRNNTQLSGSGVPGSYILILSTNSSLDPSNPALLVNNNAEGAILYTSNGLLLVGNNVIAREITGYKIMLNNNAEVEYESGLANAIFSTGTGGSWRVVSWEEIE